MSSAVQVGFFGKLPTLGDFLSRRLGAGFLERWDQWLQQGMTSAREQLGSAWTACYGAAAPWRFSMEPGACGEQALLGVMLAARDRVGRQFPLTVVATLPPGIGAFPAACGGGAWFAAVEQLLLQALEGQLSADTFDRAVQDTGPLLANLPAGESADLAVCQQYLMQHGAFRLPIGAEGIEPALAMMSAAQLARSAPPLVALWCASSSADPTLYASRGLPSPTLLGELLRWPRSSPAPQPLIGDDAFDDAPPIEPSNGALGTTDAMLAGRWQHLALAEPRDGALLAVAAATGGADEVVSARLQTLNALLRAPPEDESALLEQIEQLVASAAGLASAPGSPMLNLALCRSRELGHLFIWSGAGVVFRLHGRELTRLAPEAPQAHPAQSAMPGGGSLLDLLQQAPSDAPLGAGSLNVAHLAPVDAHDRYLLCADASYTALSWGQLVSALDESSPSYATARLREAIAARSAQAGPALVMMFDEAGEAPLVRAACTLEPETEPMAEAATAASSGGLPACS